MNLEDVLAKLNQTAAETEEVDWNAPEAGQFPPRLLPKIYDFVFKLEEKAEDQFDAVERPKGSGHWFLQMGYQAEIVDPKDPAKTVTIRFQRVHNYRHEKMAISDMADLVRSLGGQLPGRPTEQDYVGFFQAQSGRARGKAEIGWRRYCKACDVTVSTHPRKNEVKWPRNATGEPVAAVACPGCGDKGYGREEVMRFRLPEKAAIAS